VKHYHPLPSSSLPSSPPLYHIKKKKYAAACASRAGMWEVGGEGGRKGEGGSPVKLVILVETNQKSNNGLLGALRTQGEKGRFPPWLYFNGTQEKEKKKKKRSFPSKSSLGPAPEKAEKRERKVGEELEAAGQFFPDGSRGPRNFHSVGGKGGKRRGGVPRRFLNAKRGTITREEKREEKGGHHQVVIHSPNTNGVAPRGRKKERGKHAPTCILLIREKGKRSQNPPKSRTGVSNIEGGGGGKGSLSQSPFIRKFSTFSAFLLPHNTTRFLRQKEVSKAASTKKIPFLFLFSPISPQARISPPMDLYLYNLF